MDDAIHHIHHYPVDNLLCFANSYPLDGSHLSGVERYPAFEQKGPERQMEGWMDGATDYHFPLDNKPVRKVGDILLMPLAWPYGPPSWTKISASGLPLQTLVA